MLTSADAVGREFPLTLAALLPPGAVCPPDDWFARLERAGQAARDRGLLIDDLVAALPEIPLGAPAGPSPGWWTSDGRQWRLSELPSAPQFLALLRGQLGPSLRTNQPTSRGVTHQGMVRTRNEDSFVERSDIGLWAVADGAGGHGAGDVASAAVADALMALPQGLSAGEVLAQVRLRLATVHADLQQRTSPGKSSLTPVTTVVVLLARDDHFACLWAGDSRAYLMRDGALCQLTEDHSLLQELVKSAALTAAEAENHPQANIITRAVGGSDELLLDKVAGRFQPGDRLLLCTDGLFKALPEARIANIMKDGGGAEELLAQSLEAGARDNVTALIVSV
jgi:protein phosphatase/serine/threonine-protein phosphatase Stp1